MQVKSKLVILSAMALVLSPLATATWMAYGTSEPDTPYDLQGFMFTDPPTVGQKNLYFNGITFMAVPPLVAAALINPNAAALGTQNEAPHNEYHQVIMGVWTDCNGDGYVGMAESAVAEYKNELLLDRSICPAKTGSLQRWYENGEHNNWNGWVSEFIPIARNVTASQGDARLYRDDDSRVWADYGRPDHAPDHLSCALQPLPRGTLKDTGGILNYADCRSDTINVNLLENFNAVMTAAGDPAGLAFPNDDDARSGALGNTDVFGSESDSKSAAKVFDCSAAPVARSGDLLNQTPAGTPTSGPSHDIIVRPVNPSTNNLDDPTIPGQFNQTNEELGDCDTSNDAGADFYGQVESDSFNGINPENKHEADWNMRFAVVGRGTILGAALGGGAAGADQNGGVGAAGVSGSHWESTSIWLSKPGPGILKVDLESGQAGLADAHWLTFYGRVGAATTTTFGIQTPGGSGTYGSWHCGSFTSGIRNGWNCDVDTWNRNQDGTPYNDPSGDANDLRYVAPGVQYQVRDVDCYDGGNDLGVPLNPAGLGNNPCP